MRGHSGFLLSSGSGGGGKTMLSLGLCRALRRRGIAVQPFKKGPDYIDAAWLGLAARRPALNLDPFFLSGGALRRSFSSAMSRLPMPPAGRLALVEGNRGLFDGLDARGSCSSAGLARLLGLPLLICLDCSRMTRTAAAVLYGLLHFEPGLQILGVVLNRVASARHERAIRAALAEAGSPPVLGAIPRLGRDPLPERHMGLACAGPGLAADAEERLEALADLAEERLDLGPLETMATRAGGAAPRRPAQAERGSGPSIGYVRDGALWFYYPENLRALAEAGARLRPLGIVDAEGRPLFRPDNWKNLDGLYLGGGFPEDFAEALSASPALALISRLAGSGMPVYAECGGLLLMLDSLHANGRSYPMAGVFRGAATLGPRPFGLGYVEAVVMRPNPFFPVGLRLRGHEFHYSRCDAGGCDAVLGLARGRGLGGGRDGLRARNVFAAYTHIFAPAVPAWARNFVRAAKNWRACQKQLPGRLDDFIARAP